MDNLGVATTWLSHGAIFCNKGLSPTDLFYYRNFFELEIKKPHSGATFVTEKTSSTICHVVAKPL